MTLNQPQRKPETIFTNVPTILKCGTTTIWCWPKAQMYSTYY